MVGIVTKPNVRTLIAFCFSMALLFLFSVRVSPALDVYEVIKECDQRIDESGRDVAISHWTEPAKAGDAKAQFCLGLTIRPSDVWIGERNEKQAAQDARLALEWIRRSAEQGFAPGQEHLADAYAYGSDGLSQDWRKARDWMEKAANQGSPSAHMMLGTWYQDETLPPDKRRAYRHLRLAIGLWKAENDQLALNMIEFFGLDDLAEELARGLTAEDRAEAESWVESQLLKFSTQ